MKKAQMSINTIIMVIIALVVLTAIILFFTGQFAGFSEDVDALDQTSTAASAGCQLACNLEKADAGTPYTKKVCADKCSLSPCEGLIVNTMTDCPTLAEEDELQEGSDSPTSG